MRLSVLVAAVGLSVVGLSIADESHASIKQSTYIPPQPLGAALQTLAKDRGFQVVYESAEINPLWTKGATGELTAEEALTQLLSSTGMTYKFYDENAVSILPANAKTPPQVRTESTALEGTEADNAKVPRKDTSSFFRLAQTSQGSSEGYSSVDKQRENEPGSQRNPAALQEIVVTGSHIRGIDKKTDSVITINQSQIQNSGYSSTQELFRSLPQNFSSGDTTTDGKFTNSRVATNNTDYSSGVNLRGLGASSTLVLLNGHRLAPSSFGTSVDVSAVPLAAIDHVEIMPGGSSAIYGSDAVGGVVNIILKKDYQGADTSIRYGGVTEGARHEELLSQTLGTTWTGGNIVGTLQYQNQSALSATDRDFAPGLAVPSDLLPKTRSYGATLNGQQTVANGLQILTDLLISKREFASSETAMYDSGNYDTSSSGDSRNVTVAPALRYEFAPTFSVELDALYGEQHSANNSVTINPDQNYDTSIDDTFIEKSIEFIINGHFASPSAGDIGVAAGASYRREDLNASIDVSGQGAPTLIVGGRHVTAAFGEIYIPIINDANHLTLVKALELSAAVRLDKYSDFGSTTNPRFGIRWVPCTDISIRVSYGKSFRAPNANEEAAQNPAYQSAYTYQVASPDNPGVVPALVLSGSKPLTAERARTLDIGMEYVPSSFHGFSAGLNLFDVKYENRIITPPIPFNVLQLGQVYGSLITPIPNDAAAQSIVNGFEAAGGTFTDYYPPAGIAGVRYLYDDRQQNTALVRQSGIDLSSKLITEISARTLTSQLDVSYIEKIESQYAPGTMTINQVNTFGNPTKWRGRFTTTWSEVAWSLSAAVNAVGSYVNNTQSTASPSIASWYTVDANATIKVDAFLPSPVWRDFSLSLIGLNILNRNPPYLDASEALVRVNYDPANASPLGRFLAVTLRKKW